MVTHQFAIIMTIQDDNDDYDKVYETDEYYHDNVDDVDVVNDDVNNNNCIIYDNNLFNLTNRCNAI